MDDRRGISLQFELSLSWTTRQGLKSRQIAYASRNSRRQSNYSRQLPLTNTDISTTPQRPRIDTYNHSPNHRQPPYHGTAIINQPATSRLTHPPWHHNQIAQSRESRSYSLSRHDRSSSEPPAFDIRPWEIDPEPMAATAVPGPAQPYQIGRVAPATPSQFRLGADGMPWSSWTLPMPYVDDSRDEDDYGESDDEITRHSCVSPETLESVIGSTASMSRDVDDRQQGRAREMETLATAMMTVDNGFEDQWWYQGHRLSNVAGDLISSGSLS